MCGVRVFANRKFGTELMVWMPLFARQHLTMPVKEGNPHHQFRQNAISAMERRLAPSSSFTICSVVTWPL